MRVIFAIIFFLLVGYNLQCKLIKFLCESLLRDKERPLLPQTQGRSQKSGEGGAAVLSYI